MATLYPNLFKSRYATLRGRGRAWINTIDPEDRQAFINIGLAATNYGKSGGQATVKIYGKKHMRNIGRIGAIATNSWKAWHRAVEIETQRIAEEAQRQNN
jgi:hypothetical protein